MTPGLIQVYTGDGKGKTTAAFGLCLRAAGHGKRCEIIQFQKGSAYMGELYAIQRVPEITITQFGWGCPRSALIRSGIAHCVNCGDCFRRNRAPDNPLPRLGLAYAGEVLREGRAELVVLDEVSYIMKRGYVTVDEVLSLLNRRREGTEVVLTGRRMPPEIIEQAHLVTELVPQKHPLADGVSPSRRGIEY
ncbi:ATP:corrinoid adenosyltransferase btur/cobo/cobp [Heliomicrobium modesticaldum Ice1]|uniref:ATP:corrinoid adenosyltransferase btur/cobo/cobp n=1 Tax=Heliobacterium modesticaldum (strain ATCC 51547 / Ice1) TaxID=498761 RepID=B0TIK9_HELMI|nr:cob(I)yrinic acid a,c-diamide adenosyltransferase [Heliomicrobium modesticaldum]ABZ84950.1 ATP:corrinoid adenosyltransferase btur/cobo/cobp [Heliomicrobium modesticaldum Ice1]